MRYGSGRQEYGNILELIRKVRYFMFDTNRRTWHRDRCNGIFAVGSKKNRFDAANGDARVDFCFLCRRNRQVYLFYH